ncbi:MAG: hypothetical protein JNL11_14670 [Bdellovibrionaceae bacterium]|nr:hypothetical protein [Pseudobdellovibrionaceae bacterium]
MKYLITAFFVAQMATAQIATSGGLQTPIQMSLNTVTAVFNAIRVDTGLMFWTIKSISSNNNMVKVEFITEAKTCEALLYKVTATAHEGYQASLVTDALVVCSK